MTWNETAPGQHEAAGKMCHVWIEQVDPFDPYKWRRTIQIGRDPRFQAKDEYSGPLVDAKADMMKNVGRLGVALRDDAKAGLEDARRGVAVPA